MFKIPGRKNEINPQSENVKNINTVKQKGTSWGIVMCVSLKLIMANLCNGTKMFGPKSVSPLGVPWCCNCQGSCPRGLNLLELLNHLCGCLLLIIYDRLKNVQIKLNSGDCLMKAAQLVCVQWRAE